MNLGKKDLECLEIGAMLHDVGKVGIPDYLFVKDSSLIDKEYKAIKRHVTIGEV